MKPKIYFRVKWTNSGVYMAGGGGEADIEAKTKRAAIDKARKMNLKMFRKVLNPIDPEADFILRSAIRIYPIFQEDSLNAQIKDMIDNLTIVKDISEPDPRLEGPQQYAIDLPPICRDCKKLEKCDQKGGVK